MECFQLQQPPLPVHHHHHHHHHLLHLLLLLLLQAGEVRYLLNFEISYFGNLDMRTKTMQTIKTNSPNIGICAYGVCDAVQNSTGKTDTVVRAAAQTTPFPSEVARGCSSSSSSEHKSLC